MLFASSLGFLWLLGVFCGSIYILRDFFPISVKNAFGILTGIAFNLYTAYSSTDIYTILALSIHEHGTLFHLIVFFDVFHQCLVVFRVQIFHLLKLIPKHFIVFDGIVSGVNFNYFLL